MAEKGSHAFYWNRSFVNTDTLSSPVNSLGSHMLLNAQGTIARDPCWNAPKQPLHLPHFGEPQSGRSWELWANSKWATQATECVSLFDSGSETELSQDIPEGPVQASGLSDVSGQAAKAHSLQLKKGQQPKQEAYPPGSAGGFPKEV